MSKLFQNLEKFKNNTALIDEMGIKYSYNQIIKKTKHLNSNIIKKSLILLVVSNSPASIMGYVSFVRSNNTSIILDKSFKLEYVKKIIKKYRPNYLFGPKGYFNEIERDNKTINFENYNLIKTNFRKIHKINKNNLLLLSTSGTTQSPKFVRLSNLNIQNNTKNIIKYLNINSKHTTITTMPMGYSYGLSIINTHLASGSKIIINNKTIFERDFWKKVKKYKITSFGGVPQFYEQLKKLKFENLKFPTLKYLTQAGGKLEKDFLNYFKDICHKNKIKFISMYGQTEASPRMSYLKWDKFPSKIGSIGKPLTQSRFGLLSKKGKNIKKPFITGELIYFGKNVSLGYANSVNDLKKGDENKGKLYTGDLAYKDNENFYYISGRKNRISKIFGIRINLDNVENMLRKNSYKVRCVSDDKYLKILISRKYDVQKIKKLIYDSYGINNNFIIISNERNLTNLTNFKQVMK